MTSDNMEQNWGKEGGRYSDYTQEKFIHFPALSKLLQEEGMRGKSMIDIGSGAGKSSAVAREAGCEVVGVELSENLLKQARQEQPEIDFGEGNALSLPVANNSYEGALLATVLSNFESKEKIERVLTEAYRVLKPGGKLFVTIPHPHHEGRSYPGRRERAFPQPFNYDTDGQQYILKLFDERGRKTEVRNFHWRQETYEAAMSTAGFEIVRELEPHPTIELPEENNYPPYLMIVARKDPS